MRPSFPITKRNLLITSLAASFLIYLANSSVQTADPNGVGTDLYFAQAVAHGQIPLHDFNDNYGPLMNYFNALMMRTFGFDIHSLIAGKIILKTVSSGLFFLAASRIMPILFALLASLAFTVFTPDFTHNIKSYAIICVETGSLWAILSYFASAHKKYLKWAILFIAVLGLIKINFGVAILGSSFISFFIIDLFKHKKALLESLITYSLLSVLIISVWIFVYYFHIKGLTFNEIQQCLPFLNNFAYHDGSFSDGLINSIKSAIFNPSPDQFQTAVKFILFAAIIRLASRLISHYCCAQRFTALHSNCTLITIALLTCFVASNNEFYIGGADYESFYARPFAIMLMAYLISEASLISTFFVQIPLYLFFSVAIIMNVYSNWKELDPYKDQDHFFGYKGMNTHVTNDPRDMRTMIQTADYIDKNISPNQTFFAFPNDGIYYFLSGKSAPTRLIFLTHVEKINTEQEIDLINTLERKKNRYIVLDNICYFGRAYDDFGVFGQDNCPLLNKYMNKYFEEVANFGNIPGAPVGTKIFKKKTSAFITIRTPSDLD